MSHKDDSVVRSIAAAGAWSLGLFALAPFVLPGGEALAAGVATLATNVTTQVSPIATTAGTISWMAGLGFGIASMFKLKQHNDDPQRHSLKDPMMYGAVGAGLIMIPELMGYGIGSIFGATSPTMSAAGALPTITAK